METRSNHVLVGAVTLALLAGLLLFAVWLTGLNREERKCYDIYFQQGVSGLNKGSRVTYSGVEIGQVQSIRLLPERPEFVHVRIDINADTAVLQGTSAQIKGQGFTGLSEIQLDGGAKGAKPIAEVGPAGCPVIPATAGGLGALLNSAPELLDRIQRLTERLTELLNDNNQNAIADILDNVNRTTLVLRERAPEMAQALADARVAAQQAGIAAQKVGVLADSTTRLVNDQGAPAAADLRRAVASVQRAADNLDTVIADAKPGVQSFSKSTIPEANRLVKDLRELSDSLKGFSDRLNQNGAMGVLRQEKLPDYEPGKRK